MNDQFSRQAQEMFSAAKDARIPENVQAFAEDGVARARETYNNFNAVAKTSTKAFEEILLASQAGAKSIGEKVLHNASVNAEAAFDAAEAVARARTLPEAINVQSNFLQQQFAVAGAQTKELFELSTKIAKQTFESVNAAATKSFEQAKK